MRRADSVKEGTPLSLQELSRAVHVRIFWKSLTHHKVAVGWQHITTTLVSDAVDAPC